MIVSLLAILITVPFITLSVLLFNAWKLVQMLQKKLQTDGLMA
jgi:hypothetical protein